MESQVVTHVSLARARQGIRVRVLAALGPVTSLAGVVWAFVQPERVTLLHPRGQGFWWLVIEPPLLVVVAGLAFWLVVARPLLADLQEHDATAR